MFGTNELPILTTIPRSGTWFLRYVISFLCHLERGGRIDDRLTGAVIGDRAGPDFDFQRFKGGPLFRVRGVLPADHLFIGHTVCPGFEAGADGVEWWAGTRFHVPGYDYFHEGMNYRYTPVELAPYAYTPVRVPTLERAVRKGRGGAIVLVYRDPLDQAASYYRYCLNHRNASYNSFEGRPLASVPFREYLFDGALPSYARQFISFQTMARAHPRKVLLMPYERLMRDPVGVLAVMLDHLAGAARRWPMLADVVRLARPDHMKAIERELGRSLDGTRGLGGSHITQATVSRVRTSVDDAMRNEVLTRLARMGIDSGYFEQPLAAKTASAA